MTSLTVTFSSHDDSTETFSLQDLSATPELEQALARVTEPQRLKAMLVWCTFRAAKQKRVEKLRMDGDEANVRHAAELLEPRSLSVASALRGEWLAKQAKLEELELEQLEGLDWSSVALLPRLRSLKLFFSGTSSPVDLSALAACRELEFVGLYGAPKGLSLSPLAHAQKLATLDLGEVYKPTAKQLAPLAGNTQLVVVSKLGANVVTELVGSSAKAKARPKGRKKRES